MFDKIINECKEAGNAIRHGVSTTCSKIKEGYNYLGRKVERLADTHLPAPLRNIAKQAYWGSPYTAALTPFAAIGIGPLAASIALIGVRIFEHKMNPETAKRAYVGIRNFCVIGAGIDTARSIATLNPIFLINLPMYLILGAVAHLNSEATYGRRYYAF